MCHSYPRHIASVEMDGESLTIDQVVAVARNADVRTAIQSTVAQEVRRSSEWVTKVAEGRVDKDYAMVAKELPDKDKLIVYGVNTGFGSKSSVYISPGEAKWLQRNLIVSHSSGVGDPLDIEAVRAAMLLRANALVKGYSGIRLEVIQKLIDMLNKGVTPVVPAKGSVSASGDLAPLSHIALVMSRAPEEEDCEASSGEAYSYDASRKEWIRMSGRRAMEAAGISRAVLGPKEGLALNNGAQVAAAVGSLAVYDATNLLVNADIAAAMTLEALRGVSGAFRADLHRARPHPGQETTSRNIRRLVEGSTLIDSVPSKIQDAYSLRCFPQVAGAVKDTLGHVRKVVETEINSATDNPLIFLDDPEPAVSGGNFHGEPLAFAMDFLSIAVAELGNISERRIFRLTDENLSEGLPSLLIESSGLQSGLMIPQYTAAALVSENKSLAHPASVDSIPTCENQEDHVSMALIAARKATEIIRNAEYIIAIEMMCAAQALEFRMEGTEFRRKASPDELTRAGLESQDVSVKGKRQVEKGLLGKGTLCAFTAIRDGGVGRLERDRVLHIDIEKVAELIRSGEILSRVEASVGQLSAC